MARYPELRGASVRERLEYLSMPEPNSGCLLWIGTYSNPTQFGYGLVTIAPKVQRLAHRVAWEEFRGPIPDDMCVLHKCDVPPCINVDHLFLGTQVDNMADMKAKNRHYRIPARRGSKNEKAKLTESQIPLIRADTRQLSEIAADYGVHLSLIWLVQKRRIWKHVP